MNKTTFNDIAKTLAIVFWISFTPFVYSAIDSASIQGEITIDSTAIPSGTKVTAINIENGYRTSTTVIQDGRYIFTGLKPGRYTIAIGDQPPIDDEITVLVGQSATFDFEGKNQTRSSSNAQVEEVIVYGTLVKRVDAALTSTNITPDQIDRLPKVDRNFLTDANIAPGVQVDQNPDGSITFRGGAQQANRINVFIDGVSQKDNVLKSGISGQDSSRGNPFPQSAIEQYRVITSNYKAEFQHLSGAAITAVTRSGGNEVHGGVFADFTDSDLRAQTPIEKDVGEQADSKQIQYGGWISGPIKKDKLHYFLTYEHKNNDDVREITVPPEFAHLVDNYPAFLQEAIARNTGGTTASFEEDLLFAKIDWKINDKQKLDFSVKYRDEVEVTNLGGLNTFEYATNKLNEETRVRIGHQYDASFFTNAFVVTYEDTAFSPSPINRNPGLRFQVGGEDTIVGDIINLGGGADFQFKGQKGWGIKNDITFDAFNFAGEHTIKTGLTYKKIKLTAIEKNSLNPQFFFALDSVGIAVDDSTSLLEARPFRVEFGSPALIGNAESVSNNTQIGVYIQDDWRVTPRLELNIGIRYDYEGAPQYEDFVTNPEVVSALRANDDILAADYDINDYISTGSERTSFDDTWAPRLGFSYDLSEDGGLVLFGGFGRSYDRIRYDLLQLETSKDSFPRKTVYFEGAHNQPCNDPCVAWDPSFLSGDIGGLSSDVGAREIFLLNNDLSTPFSDQYSVGLSAFVGDWELETAYKHIESKEGFHWAIANRREGGRFFREGETWSWPSDAPVGNGFSNALIGRNGLESNLDSIHFKASKPHNDGQKWGATFTYTYSDAEENREFGEVFALDYPTLDGFGFNPSAGVSKHSIVSTFTYDLPFAIRFASKLTLRTAAPFYGLNCTQGFNDCFYQQGFIEEKKFIFRRWAFRQLDMAFSKNFSIKNHGGYYLRADVLNVFNARNFGDDTSGIFQGVDNWFGAPGAPNPNVGQTTGRLAGPTRTIKLSAGYNF